MKFFLYWLHMILYTTHKKQRFCSNKRLCVTHFEQKQFYIMFYHYQNKTPGYHISQNIVKIQTTWILMENSIEQYINKYFSSVIKYIFYDVSECMTLINSSFIIHTVFHHHHFRRSCITLDHYLHTYRSHCNWKIKEKENGMKEKGKKAQY